jgi:hypothetical protein
MRVSRSKPSRRSTRHTVKIPCQVVRERDFRLVADRIVDLSLSGLKVMPADPALTGERLLVSFRLPRSRIWVDVEATVSRVVHGRRPGEYTRGLGLEFEGLEGISRLMLKRLLGMAPPAPPGQRPGRRSTVSIRDLAASVARA